MRPQRSARWRSSASTRRSTEFSCAIAFSVASRSVCAPWRSIRAALISGKRLITALKPESSTATRALASTCQRTCWPEKPSLGARRAGRIRSPGPSSSLETMSSSAISRATAPLTRRWPSYVGRRQSSPLAAGDVDDADSQELVRLTAPLGAHPVAQLGIQVEQAADEAIGGVSGC